MLLRSLLVVIVASVVFPSICQAQRHDYRATRQPVVQRWNRGMGIWHGPGRHWRNPAHNSSYYNAWSAHNSSLVTQGHFPEGHGRHLYSPPQNIDPFYRPAAPSANSLPIAPLEGSYESPSKNEPQIAPPDGVPSPKTLAPNRIELIDEQDEQSRKQLNESQYELPADAYITPPPTPSGRSWPITK